MSTAKRGSRVALGLLHWVSISSFTEDYIRRPVQTNQSWQLLNKGKLSKKQRRK